MSCPKWQRKRLKEIREEVDAIKARKTTGNSKPIEQLLSEIKVKKHDKKRKT